MYAVSAKRKKCLIIGLLYIMVELFILFITVELSEKFSIIDMWCYKMGIPAWSNIDDGLHYTAVISLIFSFILIFLSVNKITAAFPKLEYSKGIIIIILIVLLPLISLSLAKGVKSFDKTLNAVYFESDKSAYNYTIEDGIMNYSARIPLQNLSNKEQFFYMKVYFSGHIDEIDETAGAIVYENDKPRLFSLLPGQKAEYKVNINYELDSIIKSGKGRGSVVKVVLYNDESENIIIRTFDKSKYSVLNN